jgi:hypothetical protein
MNIHKEVVSEDTTSFVFSDFVIVFRQLQKIEMSNQFSHNDIWDFLILHYTIIITGTNPNPLNHYTPHINSFNRINKLTWIFCQCLYICPLSLINLNNNVLR